MKTGGQGSGQGGSGHLFFCRRRKNEWPGLGTPGKFLARMGIRIRTPLLPTLSINYTIISPPINYGHYGHIEPRPSTKSGQARGHPVARQYTRVATTFEILGTSNRHGFGAVLR